MTIRHLAEKIVKTLAKAGYKAYFAGGWVRDFVMGHPSEDIDIATSAPPDVIQSLFSKTIPVGISFGVVIVLQDGHPFEVSTFRKDIGYTDGRRPDAIELATPSEDALRRDFTINGMFYDPQDGLVLDYVGGKEDIEKKIVRTIGDPHARFQEDRLRMIRAVRFAVRFGFEIEENTRRGICAFSRVLYPAVAVERVWQEWKKMCEHAGIGRAVKLLLELDLFYHMFPELKESIAELPKSPKYPPILYIAILYPNATLQKLLLFCQTYKLSNKDKEWVERYFEAKNLRGDLVGLVKFLVDPLVNPYGQLCLEAAGYSNEMIQEMKQKLAPHITRLQEHNPLVTSQDLMDEGIEPGIEMGKLLKEAEALAINRDLSSKQEVLGALKESGIWPK